MLNDFGDLSAHYKGFINCLYGDDSVLNEREFIDSVCKPECNFIFDAA